MPQPGGESLRTAPGAIVLGASYRALGVVRSLGRRGIPVWVVTRHYDRLASLSNYAHRTLVWRSQDHRARVDFLKRAASEYGLDGWVLFPTDDDTAVLLSRHREELRQTFRFTSLPWESFQWLYDKRLTYALARRLNISCPWTSLPKSRAELRDLDCSFPVILKPAFKKTENGFTTAKAWRVNDRHSLWARYDEACSLVPPDTIMVQEFVPGDGESQLSYVAVMEDGETLGCLVARRGRQMPMDFGRFSTYVETVADPGISESARRLLSAVQFTGIAEVEFKRDPRTGLYQLLDINPRVWGWHTLCGRAGIDMSYLLWCLSQGIPVPDVAAKVGVRWVWTTVDGPVALRQVLSGKLPLRHYLRSFRGVVEHATYAPDDPIPCLLNLPLMSYKAALRRFGRSGQAQIED